MSEKSALRLIPGKDALLEYVPQPYKAKTYVEYQALIYKSLVDTSPTFVPTEWELIADLREVRVRTIGDRNTLTGTTVTSGNTGIHIPILDNTNVLVLHAQADPQVGADKFARYNYNKTTNSFLLLQVSTGSTSSNVSDYNVLTNKPPIISGVTAIASSGLTGGGIFSGGVPPTRATFSFAHADTSSQANINATGLTYVQKLKFDTYGHVTGATTSTWVHPDTSSQPNVNGSGFTYIQSIGLDTDGHVVSLGQSTWVHPDTSSQGTVINTGNNVIQSIGLDTDGHVTGLTSVLVSGGGGGGVNFSVAGNSGGSQVMPNGGTLQITGGSNILTTSSLHGANVGARIDFVPAGATTQVQLNISNQLSSTTNLTFTGNTTLVTPNLIGNTLRLNASPTSGATSDQFITRNPVNGNLQTVNLSTIERAIVGQPVNSIQFNKGSLLAGNPSWIFDSTFSGVTLGTRSAGTTGQLSLTVGQSNAASGNSSFAGGVNSKAYNTGSFAYGSNAKASGFYAFANGINTQALNSNDYAEGGNTIASGGTSHVEGANSIAGGSTSHAQGSFTYAKGVASFVGGSGFDATKRILAAGTGAINLSTNSISQTPGFGALANQSTILGGQDHHIASNNTNSSIIVGTLNKINGISTNTYIFGGNQNVVSGGTIQLQNSGIFGGNGNTVAVNANTSGLYLFGGGSNSITGGSLSVIIGGGSNVIGGGATNVMVGGGSNKMLGLIQNSTIIGGGSNIITPSSGTYFHSGIAFGSNNTLKGVGATSSNIFGGTFNTIIGSGSTVGNAIFGGQNHFIRSGTQYSQILGGSTNTISGNTSINSIQYSSIFAGNQNQILNRVVSGAIVAGNANIISGSTTSSPAYNGIFAGQSNRLIGNTSYSTIIGGFGNQITGGTTTNNAIISSSGSRISASLQNSVIIGGSSITLSGVSQNNHVVVPNLMIWGLNSPVGTNETLLSLNPSTRKVGGTSQWFLNGPTNSVTLGTRAAGASGQNTFATGNNNLVNMNLGVVFGTNNVMIGTGVTSPVGSFIFGQSHLLKPVGAGSYNLGNGTSVFDNGSMSGIFGGSQNTITGNTTQSVIVGGSLNILGKSAFHSGILGGYKNIINGFLTNGVVSSFIVGGFSNQLLSTVVGGSIIGGTFNTIKGNAIPNLSEGNQIIGGYNNLIDAGSNVNIGYGNSMLGSHSSSITGASNSALIGGNSNVLYKAVNTVIVGGTNITVSGNSQDNHAVVPNLMIWNTPATSTADKALTWNSQTKKVGISTNLSSGTYTPVVTVVNNVAANTSYGGQWMRIGNIVSVGVRIDITVTTANSLATIGISLPIPSIISLPQQLTGQIGANTTSSNSGVVYGDNTNNRANMNFLIGNTLNTSYFINFIYQVN